MLSVRWLGCFWRVGRGFLTPTLGLLPLRVLVCVTWHGSSPSPQRTQTSAEQMPQHTLKILGSCMMVRYYFQLRIGCAHLEVEQGRKGRRVDRHQRLCKSCSTDSGYHFSWLASSVISVNGWHELFELHSYRCNID
jgi:hypothetical protein